MPGWQPLGEMDEATIASKLRGYRAKLVTDSTMTKVAHDLSDEEISAVADFYASNNQQPETSPVTEKALSAHLPVIDVECLKTFFLYAALINWGILLYWFLCLMFLKQWVYNFHRRWFDLSDQELDRIHYGALAAYKLAIIVLFLTPWLVLLILH
jgi:hypothetical protein